MPESRSHRTRKRKDAGLTGRTEVRLPSGTFLDALSGTGIATETERGGAPGIKKAVSRLEKTLEAARQEK